MLTDFNNLKYIYIKEINNQNVFNMTLNTFIKLLNM